MAMLCSAQPTNGSIGRRRSSDRSIDRSSSESVPNRCSTYYSSGTGISCRVGVVTNSSSSSSSSGQLRQHMCARTCAPHIQSPNATRTTTRASFLEKRIM
jgi:hypothetical protein